MLLQVLLTLLNLCLLIDALPSVQNVKILTEGNRLVKDESDSSSENSGENVMRSRKIYERKLTGSSKCGYEVRMII